MLRENESPVAFRRPWGVAQLSKGLYGAGPDESGWTNVDTDRRASVFGEDSTLYHLVQGGGEAKLKGGLLDWARVNGSEE